MLSEEKILILNRMKINSPKLYEKALDKLGMQDSDIPVCNVPDKQLWREKQAGQTKQTDARTTYYLAGRPYFGIPPEGYQNRQRSSLQNKTGPVKRQVNARTGKTQTNAKKKNTALFVDGENISYKKADEIIEYAEAKGCIDFDWVRVYFRQKDPSTEGWGKIPGLKSIRLFGEPEKDKIDKKYRRTRGAA